MTNFFGNTQKFSNFSTASQPCFNLTKGVSNLSNDAARIRNTLYVYFILFRSSIPPLSDVLTEVRAQLIQYTALIVQGRVIPGVEEGYGKSPLLAPIVQQTIPR